MKKVFFLIILFSNISYAKDIKTFDSKSIKTLDAEILSGEVFIEGTTDKNSEVTVEKINFDEKKCKLEVKQDRAKLIVNTDFIDSESYFFRNSKKSCNIKINIKIPNSIDLKLDIGDAIVKTKNTIGNCNVELSSGSLFIDSKIKDLDADFSSGNIEINDIVENAKINGSSGSLKIKKLTNNLDIGLSSGSIDIGYEKCPTNIKSEIEVSSGSITLAIPKACKISSDVEVSSGSVKNDFENSKNPNIAFSIDVSSGIVKLRKK